MRVDLILGVFERKIREAEARVRQAMGDRELPDAGEEIGERLSREMSRLEEEREELRKVLASEESGKSVAVIWQKIERLGRQIEKAERTRVENRGFIRCLRY